MKYKNVILLGDFNTVLSKLDMADGMVFKNDTGRKELKLLMENNNMVDVWRERNEKSRKYSRRATGWEFHVSNENRFYFSFKEYRRFY